MQHDIVELLDAIVYAKENFGNDKTSKFYFTREEKTDAFGQAYREDMASFECVLLIAHTAGTKITITVIGLADDVAFQREFIAAEIDKHRANNRG